MRMRSAHGGADRGSKLKLATKATLSWCLWAGGKGMLKFLTTARFPWMHGKPLQCQSKSSLREPGGHTAFLRSSLCYACEKQILFGPYLQNVSGVSKRVWSAKTQATIKTFTRTPTGGLPAGRLGCGRIPTTHQPGSLNIFTQVKSHHLALQLQSRLFWSCLCKHLSQ